MAGNNLLFLVGEAEEDIGTPNRNIQDSKE
jgi:hypothetical protein